MNFIGVYWTLQVAADDILILNNSFKKVGAGQFCVVFLGKKWCYLPITGIAAAALRITSH